MNFVCAVPCCECTRVNLVIGECKSDLQLVRHQMTMTPRKNNNNNNNIHTVKKKQLRNNKKNKRHIEKGKKGVKKKAMRTTSRWVPLFRSFAWVCVGSVGVISRASVTTTVALRTSTLYYFLVSFLRSLSLLGHYTHHCVSFSQLLLLLLSSLCYFCLDSSNVHYRSLLSTSSSSSSSSLTAAYNNQWS